MELRRIIKSGWNGDAELSSAFWLYFVCGQFAVALALVMLVSPTVLIGSGATQATKVVTYPIFLITIID